MDEGMRKRMLGQVGEEQLGRLFMGRTVPEAAGGDGGDDGHLCMSQATHIVQ